MNEAIDIARGATEAERAMTMAHSWARGREIGKKLFESAVTL
jgi:hypothetical protein